jgi:hypothetical protein
MHGYTTYRFAWSPEGGEIALLPTLAPTPRFDLVSQLLPGQAGLREPKRSG